MQHNPNYYAIIPADVRYSDIIPNAKLLYGEITALCNKEGFCWASNAYFGKLYSKNTTTISEWVSVLKKHGFIRTEVEGKDRKIYLTTLREKPKNASGKAEGYPSGKAEHINTRVNNTEEEQGQAPAGHNPLGAEVLKEFESINHACKSMYSNKTQRGACDDLIRTYGLEMVIKVVHFLPKSNARAYLPTITTPVQLRDKWAALEAGLVKEKGKTLSAGRGVA